MFIHFRVHMWHPSCKLIPTLTLQSWHCHGPHCAEEEPRSWETIASNGWCWGSNSIVFGSKAPHYACTATSNCLFTRARPSTQALGKGMLTEVRIQSLCSSPWATKANEQFWLSTTFSFWFALLGADVSMTMWLLHLLPTNQRPGTVFVDSWGVMLLNIGVIWAIYKDTSNVYCTPTNCLMFAVECKACSMGPGVKQNWVRIPTLSLISCETVFLKPPFLYLCVQKTEVAYRTACDSLWSCAPRGAYS